MILHCCSPHIASCHGSSSWPYEGCPRYATEHRPPACHSETPISCWYTKRPPVTVMRPSGSWVTMWSREAEAVSFALGSTARGRSPLQALCTSLRRTSTVRYSEMASRMNWISSSVGCGRVVISELLSAQQETGPNHSGSTCWIYQCIS